MSKRNKPYIAIAFIILLASSLLSSCSILPKEEQGLQPPLVQPAQENYNTVKVEKGTVSKEIKGAGIFVSTKMDSAQFINSGGRLEKINVQSGDQVKKGDVLVQLTVDGLDLQLKEQELALVRAQYMLKIVNKTKGIDPENVKIAKLGLEIEQIKYDRLQQSVDGKQLKAKIDGQVTFITDLIQGSIIEPYQTLVVVADISKLIVAWNPSNTEDIQKVELGMSVDVTMNTGDPIIGKVVQTPSSAPTTQDTQLADKYSKTLYVEMDKLPDGAEMGTTASLSIYLQKHDNVLKIPLSGLRTYLGRNFVQAVEGEGLREFDVETGIQSSVDIEITKGLKEGQVVVLQN
ncbi:efflux RND transporter periplasmic adaptor subunit [Paenibacillus psychroresistens]|uniref:efflux RND transporter periplasmic adaptor subunit n=1 Tax=Paenibacillus psychroresistens TaxID=1778678 RepID=UPI001391A781|nr:biotin/lipoyl-binding protein [Paenibacillus psychroresistens]